MKPKTVGRVSDEQVSSPNAQSLCCGLPVGTPILTSQGTMAVEFLSAGDNIITRNGGAQPLVDVHATTHATRGIKFTAGCFGESGPAEDVILPPDQPMLLRDWRARAFFGQSQAMIRAGQLVDDEFILDIGPRKLVLFRLAFDRPRIIYANGIELGTSDEAMTPHRAVA